VKVEEKQHPVRLSTARSRELGEELRRARRQAGISSAATADGLEWSLGKLSKLETGVRGTHPRDIATLLGRYAADKAARDRIMAIATEHDSGSFLRLHDRSPDTLVALTLHERMARTITTYDPVTVPALAQTEDYASALLGDAD
jgi:transcriptional regulator with XRE-family HTH domain